MAVAAGPVDVSMTLRALIWERVTSRSKVVPGGSDWVVLRGNGYASAAVEAAVLESLVYSPEIDRFLVVGPIVRTGATFVVRQ